MEQTSQKFFNLSAFDCSFSFFKVDFALSCYNANCIQAKSPIFCQRSQTVGLQPFLIYRRGKKMLKQFELYRCTQQPSLTFSLVGGSTFGLWPLFHLRYGGKWTEMTATQHGGTLRHVFLHYITIKIMLGFFHFVFSFFKFNVVIFLCDVVSPSTGCMSQLF
jgi:hypothetical protein